MVRRRVEARRSRLRRRTVSDQLARRGRFRARAKLATPTRCFRSRRIFENDDETKPAMVWFTSLNPDEKAEKRLFDSWEVAVASRYFTCVKIYTDDIEPKADREKYAGRPRSSCSTTLAARSRGSWAPARRRRVYAAMQKAAAPTFKKPLGALVETYSDFLKKFDKVRARSRSSRRRSSTISTTSASTTAPRAQEAEGARGGDQAAHGRARQAART